MKDTNNQQSEEVLTRTDLSPLTSNEVVANLKDGNHPSDDERTPFDKLFRVDLLSKEELTKMSLEES